MHCAKSFISMQSNSLPLDADFHDLRRGFWMLKTRRWDTEPHPCKSLNSIVPTSLSQDWCCKVWVALVSIFLHEKLVSRLQEHHLIVSAYPEVYMEDAHIAYANVGKQMVNWVCYLVQFWWWTCGERLGVVPPSFASSFMIDDRFLLEVWWSNEPF